ncbi:helix-turn-helix domain-containing protein [Sphingomonas trueperi]|uniref:helix-turn-helix domain-containing protein n=1 Tax=Sphingomonas trueperi TaxID=53317 RepID=UPI000EB0A3D9
MGATITGGDSEKLRNSPAPLTKRQVECLGWVYRGYETKEIARELGLSPETVDMHIKNATQRLGVPSRKVAARLIHGGTNIPQSLVPPSPGISAGSTTSDAEASAALGGAAPPDLVEVLGLPFPTEGAPINHLTSSQRLFWVAAIAVGVVVGFGALISSLQALGQLLHP